jgi:hypothetical protein
MEVMNYQGTLYNIFGRQSLIGQKQEYPRTYDGITQSFYHGNAVIFACMNARLRLFSQANLMFRQRKNGRPGDLFSTAELAIFEQPWPGATFGDLLGRMITDADVAGNSYTLRRSNRLVRLRPDWITILMGSNSDDTVTAWDVDSELLGYIYHPGGATSGSDPKYFAPDQIAHFCPTPDPLSPFRGMTWLTPLVREVMADGAATSHKLKFFENGATPNMIFKVDPSVTFENFLRYKEAFKAEHEGVRNAYKALFLGGGADATVVGTNLRQLDFSATQGAGEVRIAAAAGVHPTVIGLSEGLQGSSLNAGNFGAARRLVSDVTLRHLWQNMAGSLARIVAVPGGSELWYDDRDIPFLQEDEKDRADIEQVQAVTIRQLIEAGFKADAVIAAVLADDMALLKGQHTGLFSVQLQAPGSTKMPEGEAPGETPVGPGTAPEKPAIPIAPTKLPGFATPGVPNGKKASVEDGDAPRRDGATTLEQ